MLAIVDADSLCIACAATASKDKDIETGKSIWHDEEVIHTYSNVKSKMLKILERTGCTDYKAFLTKQGDTDSFRKKLYPDYKANRIGKDRPIYEEEARKYLITQWHAEVVSEIEADDQVCIEQYKVYENNFYTPECLYDHGAIQGDFPGIICGIDKDLNQIPGLHYNYKKDTFYYITPIQGLRNLYMQMLTGDDSDNIPRCAFRWGIKKEHKEVKEAVSKAGSEYELYRIVLNTLEEFLPINEVETRVKWLGDLLYLRKSIDDSYRIPLCQTVDTHLGQK